MKPVVFAGPSMHGLALAGFADVDLAPPAACGDILRAVRAGRRSIGLIDGYFESVAAVWHKEILYALAQGVRVLGAASMGALRAAECGTFGMQGVGEVFRQYRDGERDADADVAVTHATAELGYQPLTLALVDVEHGLDRLAQLGAEVEAARALARRMHYRNRTWDNLLPALPPDEPMRRTLRAAMNLKQRDALLLLREISGAKPAAPAWKLEGSLFLDRLLAQQRRQP